MRHLICHKCGKADRVGHGQSLYRNVRLPNGKEFEICKECYWIWMDLEEIAILNEWNDWITG